MIKITRSEDCTGCRACGEVCPKDCIAFKADAVEGFAYPEVDMSRCIDCHLCERVCPVIHADTAQSEPMRVISAWSPCAGERKDSSSGGVFSLFAADVIGRGGVVVGVAMTDDFRSARHIEVDSIDGLGALRGSKYLQADATAAYKIVQSRLKEGRPVLFSGTPCQVAGMRRFLGKKADDEHLLLVDVICHGTPSPEAWRVYLDGRAKGEAVAGVNFRDKSGSGWRSFGLSLQLRPYDLQPSDEGRLAAPCGRIPHAGEPGVVSECHRTDLYMRSFLSNVNLRPSCYECPSNAGRSGSDITLADFWGYPHREGDEHGVSQVLVRTDRGAHALEALSLLGVEDFSYDVVLRNNPCVAHSVASPERRKYFWRHYRRNFSRAVAASAPREPLIYRIKVRIAALLGR